MDKSEIIATILQHCRFQFRDGLFIHGNDECENCVIVFQVDYFEYMQYMYMSESEKKDRGK